MIYFKKVEKKVIASTCSCGAPCAEGKKMCEACMAEDEKKAAVNWREKQEATKKLDIHEANSVAKHLNAAHNHAKSDTHYSNILKEISKKHGPELSDAFDKHGHKDADYIHHHQMNPEVRNLINHHKAVSNTAHKVMASVRQKITPQKWQVKKNGGRSYDHHKNDRLKIMTNEEILAKRKKVIASKTKVEIASAMTARKLGQAYHAQETHHRAMGLDSGSNLSTELHAKAAYHHIFPAGDFNHLPLKKEEHAMLHEHHKKRAIETGGNKNHERLAAYHARMMK